MRFGFLSTADNLLLPFLINSALDNGIKEIYIILDSKSTSEKDKAIWERRTEDRFGKFSVFNKSLFALRKFNVPFYFVDNHNSEASIELYKELKLKCLFNAGTPRKISSKLLDLKNIPEGVINIHPGKLPEYRGCSCVEWAIVNDDPIFNTVHYMDLEYDTGPIIKSMECRLDSKSNYVDIRSKVYLDGCKLSIEVLKSIQNNTFSIKDAQIQDHNKAKYWKPMPIKIEEECILKANDQKYKYQRL